jgi:hypothetical protein
MTRAQWHPLARTDGLTQSQVGDEVVVYDMAMDRAHCLNPSAAALWRACNGLRTPQMLAEALGVDDVDLVWHGLRQLADETLLQTPVPEAHSSRLSRRDYLRKIAIGAAIGWGVPTVLSIVVPEAAAAASCLPAGASCLLNPKPCCPGLTCTILSLSLFTCQ